MLFFGTARTGVLIGRYPLRNIPVAAFQNRVKIRRSEPASHRWANKRVYYIQAKDKIVK